MTKQQWIEIGYNGFVAEALEGRSFSRADVEAMSDFEVMDHVLEWHGIVHYTRCIIDAIDNIRNMEAL